MIPSPAGGSLAVDHDHQFGHLGTSADLMTWPHRAVIDEPAPGGKVDPTRLEATVARANASNRRPWNDNRPLTRATTRTSWVGTFPAISGRAGI